MAKMKRLSMLLAAVMVTAPLAACDRTGADRWATTENTNVKIDWDKVNEAYKSAEGPEDFEKKVNEIYEGDEVISVAVEDKDAKTQVVTGFFDKNASGGVEEDEKIFTITRNITGEGTGQYQVSGYGPYYGYHSPFLSIASGMLLGSMLSSAFMPGYAPMYSRPYVTSASRASSLRSSRDSYRAANPSKFTRTKASASGKTYNRTGSGRSFGGRSGGTRFGGRGRVRTSPPRRLDA